jgi:hypothetical protein
MVAAVGVDDFVADQGDGLEKKLADVGEQGGVAGRDAVLGDGGEEFAEDVVDIGGGVEVAGERSGDAFAEAFGFEELALGAGVEDAQGWVILVAGHAALAAVGEREVAEMGIVGSGSFSSRLNLVSVVSPLL